MKIFINLFLMASAATTIQTKPELAKDSLLSKTFSSDLKKLFSTELNEKTPLAEAVQLTINSLESGACPSAQKIRAYKSIGAESIKMSQQISAKETWLINPLWRELWLSGKKIGGADISWRKKDELKDLEKFSTVVSAGEVPTEFISFSLNPLYVSDQGPAFIVAEFCPDRVIFPPKITKDLQELEILVPLFVTPKEIVSVKGIECLEIKDPLKQKDCGGVLADNVQTLSANSILARKCYANFAHEVEYKYMDDSPVDLTLMIRYEGIAKNLLGLLDSKMSNENYRKELGTRLAKNCSANCADAKSFIEAMDELSENGESEVSADLIEADIVKYKASISKVCGEMKK